MSCSCVSFFEMHIYTLQVNAKLLNKNVLKIKVLTIQEKSQLYLHLFKLYRIRPRCWRTKAYRLVYVNVYGEKCATALMRLYNKRGFCSVSL